MFDSDFNETEDEISDDDKEEATVRRCQSPPLSYFLSYTHFYLYVQMR